MQEPPLDCSRGIPMVKWVSAVRRLMALRLMDHDSRLRSHNKHKPLRNIPSDSLKTLSMVHTKCFLGSSKTQNAKRTEILEAPHTAVIICSPTIR